MARQGDVSRVYEVPAQAHMAPQPANEQLDVRNHRPTGWEESDDEDDSFLKDNTPSKGVPPCADDSTWIRELHHFLQTGWQAFDKWAAGLLGLDKSKFDWAITEKEIQDHQELQERALDNLSFDRQLEKMESGVPAQANPFLAPEIESIPSTSTAC